MGVQSFDFVPTLVAGEGALWTTDATGPIVAFVHNGQVGELSLSRCGLEPGSMWRWVPHG